MLVSEKNFLERLASRIPGVAGYRDREARRETDRRLREYLARRVEEASAELQGLRLRLTDAGRLAPLDELGRLDRTMASVAASLRWADAGYGGLFDQVKIGERELDQIYAFDLALLEGVEGLARRVHDLVSGDDVEPGIVSADGAASALLTEIGQRKDLFEHPER